MTLSPDCRRELGSRQREHQDAMLDEALAETFPASDPIAISIPSVAKRRPLARTAARWGADHATLYVEALWTGR